MQANDNSTQMTSQAASMSDSIVTDSPSWMFTPDFSKSHKHIKVKYRIGWLKEIIWENTFPLFGASTWFYEFNLS